MDIIQTDAGKQLTSKEFQGGIYVRVDLLSLAAPDNQVINGQAEVTWKTFQNIAHSIMVHSQVSDEYIYLALMYTTYHIFLVLSIKYLVNQDGEPTTPRKLETGTKLPVSNLRVLFYQYDLLKSTTHVDTKALNMRHQYIYIL